MHERRIPEWLRHAPAPSVRGFAMLAAAEAVARGILISVFPLQMYRALQDAALVSQVYFMIGVMSLLTGLLVPFLARFVPRRWVYMAGASCFVAGSLLAIDGSAPATIIGLLLISIATVTTFVCFNAYVLDYIAKIELGRCETSRMFYSAAGWTIGPVLGVTLLKWWEPAPFLVAATASLTMLLMFLAMRLGNGKLITKSRAAPTNPLGFLPRFFAQPRLVAGWLFAVIRSCGWWVYVVYLPIFAIQSGLGDQLGGIALSISNAALFVTPFMLRWMQRHSIRRAVRTGFLLAGLLFTTAAILSGLPWIAVLCMMTGSFFLILLDVSAGLPFLLAVKPSERTEMSAVYSSFRDVSGIMTPGVAWLVLLVAPLAGIFAAGGTALLGAWALSQTLPMRLGKTGSRPAPIPEPVTAIAPPIGAQEARSST
ncbi:MFS transporter [Marivita lacus]|uniref:MFS transporter n=1 Tax=Marivita lacus TaxID=1323742 RepID=A0ABQ1K9Y9_9RHOB|nr:MFS transporter [Marivita lacus]GGB87544.1 MFS transporter [Marivita lacus]